MCIETMRNLLKSATSYVKTVPPSALRPLPPSPSAILQPLPSGPQIAAKDLWLTQSVVILVTRRPGCFLCREEATKLYDSKPELDKLGIRLVTVIKENIPEEVADFQKFWPGEIYWDVDLHFYQALGGGQLYRSSLLGFLTQFFSPFDNPIKANGQRAKNAGFTGNLKGEGLISGGLYIIRRGGEMEYSFLETNIGDHAPVSEVLEVCRKIAE